jgi:hypothetical protein
VSAQEKLLLLRLRRLRQILDRMEDGLRPPIEYLRDEIHNLATLVDNLRGKVENEKLLIRDKRELQQ